MKLYNDKSGKSNKPSGDNRVPLRMVDFVELNLLFGTVFCLLDILRYEIAGC